MGRIVQIMTLNISIYRNFLTDDLRMSQLGHLSQQILRTLLSPMFYPIGIQVRTDDNLTSYGISNNSQAAVMKETLAVLFQNHIICAQDLVIKTVFHVSYTSQTALTFQLTMFDIFLFGFCKRHIISTTSGFDRIAVFASLTQQNIYSLSSNQFLFCRNDNQSISSIDSGYYGLAYDKGILFISTMFSLILLYHQKYILIA